jgi:hypothetical protein
VVKCSHECLLSQGTWVSSPQTRFGSPEASLCPHDLWPWLPPESWWSSDPNSAPLPRVAGDHH